MNKKAKVKAKPTSTAPADGADRPDRVENIGAALVLLAAFVQKGMSAWEKDFAKSKEVRAVLDAAPKIQVQVAELATRLSTHRSRTLLHPQSPAASLPPFLVEASNQSSVIELVRLILMRTKEWPPAILAAMLKSCTFFDGIHYRQISYMGRLIGQVEAAAEKGLEPELKGAMEKLVAANNFCGNRPDQEMHGRLSRLLTQRAKTPLFPGEAWADAALAEINAAAAAKQNGWVLLLGHAGESSGSGPSAKWQKGAALMVKNLGFETFKKGMLAWLPLVNLPRTQPAAEWEREYQPDPNQLIIEPHADILKGLAWFCGLREDKDLARTLTALAISAYRKVPMIGPRAVKVGNACVTALGMMPGMEGVYQLALLKVKIKFGTAQKGIEKALNATAERVGIPRDELEEMAVPEYGLTEVGKGTETFGEFTAELRAGGPSGAEIAWFKADGKPVKSVPAAVKQNHGEDLKELQAAVKDMQRMLPAQKERIDSLFLQQRTWPLALWRERYLDHPLVGVLARRLIWEFTTGGKTVAGIWWREADQKDGALVDLDLRPVKVTENTTVALWHPIGKNLDEIVAWRTWFDTQQIQQPFKQAHREVYLLTDAERNTRTYSNRYAAHILKQHQFNSLAALRGWKNKLRLSVDAEFPPASLYLPKYGLRAEFWIEGIGDNFGTDINDSGVFLRVATDQVRFYKIDAPQVTGGGYSGAYSPRHGDMAAEPLLLTDIPPLVFSEVMRDVDLFVGVASVGNDPAWNDGGPDGTHRDYWQSYSFGDLSATAQTRKAVLERLVPRLKIAKQCSFADKFLVVKGSVRTYKIHLGSGNILMLPNDQYLCIVAKQGVGEDGKVFLPFEGDRTLSLILSKAFLLADDAKIKDATILSQLTR